MNVLLAVDQSRHSGAAAKWVKGLRFPPGSILHVLHVFGLKQWPEWSTFEDVRKFRNKVAAHRGAAVSKAHRFIDRIAELLQTEKMEVQTRIVEGIPGAEILTAIKEHQIDLVVVGAKGLSGMKRFLLGSVSEWVLSDAPCSVLAVRGQPRWTQGSARSLRILIATDGSQDAKSAVSLLKQFHLPPSTHLYILHVVETAGSLTSLSGLPDHLRSTPLGFAIKETREQMGKRLLQETRRNWGRKQLHVDVKVTNGHAAEEILKAINRLRVDLVVMGSRGLTGMRRFLLGSVANSVVRHASCSVLVVRPSPTKMKSQTKT